MKFGLVQRLRTHWVLDRGPWPSWAPKTCIDGELPTQHSEARKEQAEQHRLISPARLMIQNWQQIRQLFDSQPKALTQPFGCRKALLALKSGVKVLQYISRIVQSLTA